MSKNLRRLSVLAALATLMVGLLIVGQGMAQTELSDKQQLGSSLYFDENLSNPAGQSCASCHDPAFGFVDPDKGQPVSEGVIPGLFGGRNSPSSAYAMYAPMFHFDGELWIGGQFWDGRATGAVLDDPLADQAVGPFLNPVEMANKDSACVVYKVCNALYPVAFTDVYGIEACDITWPADVEEVCAAALEHVPLSMADRVKSDDAYALIGKTIAAFERTPLFGQFSSKYDHYLEACLGAQGEMDDCAKGNGLVAEMVGSSFFTKKEWYGMQLFMGENNNNGTLEPGEGAMCAACHAADWTAATEYDLDVVVPGWAPEGWVPPVFTDFSFDNLGVPKSQHRLLVNNMDDLGLGGPDSLNNQSEDGKFKVMTLRNIHLTAPYAHNGYFKKLDDITHFYNTRDVEDWPEPEIPVNVNDGELGNLGLTRTDEEALVKFMKTLTDGWVP
jgi:cytochrome c peroxidase